MNLKEAIQKAEEKTDIIRANGILVFLHGADRFVVLDRDTGKFVKTDHFRSRWPPQGYSFRQWLADSYQHGKDLLNILRNYGLRATIQYEYRVIKEDLRELEMFFQKPEPLYGNRLG